MGSQRFLQTLMSCIFVFPTLEQWYSGTFPKKQASNLDTRITPNMLSAFTGISGGGAIIFSQRTRNFQCGW